MMVRPTIMAEEGECGNRRPGAAPHPGVIQRIGCKGMKGTGCLGGLEGQGCGYHDECQQATV